MGHRLSRPARLIFQALSLTLVVAGCAPTPPAAPTLRQSGRVHVGQRSLEARLHAEEAHVDQLNLVDGAPPVDMAWRLETHVGTLAQYVRTVRDTLASPSLPESTRERLNGRLARAEEALRSYRETLAHVGERVDRQVAVVDELNRDFGCHIRRYDQGQQVNFARELSLPECSPLVVGDYARAAAGLNTLAEASLPVDAEVMTSKAKSYLAVGRLVRDLDGLKKKLLEIKVIRVERGRPRVELIGHPFQAENNTDWLEAYIHATRKLNRELEKQGEPVPVNGCPEPACDLSIYRVAEAVTLKPPLDWTFLDGGPQVMAPTPYGLSYFSQRYDANGEIRESLSLGSNREWHWRSEDYVNILNADDQTLTFTHIFADQKVLLSVARWDQKTEFPYVVPIFYLFNEARRVIDLLKTMPATSVASRIRDIQFAPADDSGNFVNLSKVPEGLRLTLSVLKPTGGKSIAEVREELHRQIPVVVSRGAVSP